MAGYSCAKLALVVYHGTSLPVWTLALAANVVFTHNVNRAAGLPL